MNNIIRNICKTSAISFVSLRTERDVNGDKMEALTVIFDIVFVVTHILSNNVKKKHEIL